MDCKYYSVFGCFKFSSFFTLLAGERPQRVTVYRSSVKKDLIKIFSNPRIFSYSFDVVVIDVRSEPEDRRGKEVLLDVMTCFWQECFIALTNGSNEKIPYIRHDLQNPEWKAIARVLVYGY